MPIQNVGTLIENLVVTECASVLFERVPPGQAFGFVSAFAMPPLTEWRPHNQAIGMSTAALQRISTSRGGTDFINVMRACLRHAPEQGPNGALLVGVLAAQRNRRTHIWANDIEEGHYGNAIPALEDLEAVVRRIVPGSEASLMTVVCSAPYPDSIPDLKTTLEQWGGTVDVVLGFLDPMRYVREPRGGPYTSSSDHKRWLWALRAPATALAVQFTGNSDSTSLTSELDALHSDLEDIGFPFWLEVRRQHYVVSVASRTPEVLNLVERKTIASWSSWCDIVGEIKSRHIDICKSTAA
jgi:hypothetical protein